MNAPPEKHVRSVDLGLFWFMSLILSQNQHFTITKHVQTRSKKRFRLIRTNSSHRDRRTKLFVPGHRGCHRQSRVRGQIFGTPDVHWLLGHTAFQTKAFGEWEEQWNESSFSTLCQVRSNLLAEVASPWLSCIWVWQHSKTSLSALPASQKYCNEMV